MKNTIHIYLIIVVSLLLSACSGNIRNDEGMSLVKKTNPIPLSLEKNTKKELDLIGEIELAVEDFDEIYDVAVLKGKKDTLVAYKVRHLKRFRMKKIEKEVLDHLKKKFPDENFTVSSDYKIFLETMRLEKDLMQPDFPLEEGEKRLKKIIKLTKELT